MAGVVSLNVFKVFSSNCGTFLKRFDFCHDDKESRPSENLGQVLFGERIETSPYKVRIMTSEYVICPHGQWEEVVTCKRDLSYICTPSGTALLLGHNKK